MEYRKHENLDLLYNLSKLYEEELNDSIRMKQLLDKGNLNTKDLQEKIIMSSNVLKSIDEIKYHIEIGYYDHLDIVDILIKKVDYHMNNIQKLNNEK